MTLSTILALGAIGLGLAAVVLLLALILRMRLPAARKFVDIAGAVAAPLSFFIVLFASLITLYHSEIVGIEPCGLCWLSRTMMYPLVAVFLIMWLRRDCKAWIYGAALAIVGLLISLYHHALQMGID